MELKMDEEELLLFNKFNDTRIYTSNIYFDNRIYTSNFIFFCIIYLVILLSVILLNILGPLVVSRNPSMHTPTNVYLSNFSISTLFFLITELPIDLYPLSFSFQFQFSCMIISFVTQTFSNSSLLTIIPLTIERYICICYPLQRHKRKPPGALKYIILVWIFAMGFAALQVWGSVKFRHEEERDGLTDGRGMAVQSSFAIFVLVMFVIILFNALMYFELKKHPAMPRRDTSRRRVYWMLVAVPVLVFLCWAPFHALRLNSIFGKNLEQPDDTFPELCTFLTHPSGILYWHTVLMTAINPFLFCIMSSEFRNAFKVMLTSLCRGRARSRLDRTHSDLLESRNELAEASAEQCPRRSPLQLPTISSQLCDAPPRAQSLNISDVVIEESELWRWRQFAGGLNTLTAPQSVLNSSLREIDQEKSMEVIYLHQVNSKSVGEDRDTSVEDQQL